jgi:hypothetical protein
MCFYYNFRQNNFLNEGISLCNKEVSESMVSFMEFYSMDTFSRAHVFCNMGHAVLRLVLLTHYYYYYLVKCNINLNKLLLCSG